MKELPDDLTPAEKRAIAADDHYWHVRKHGTAHELHQAGITRELCIWHAFADGDRIDDLIRREETNEP